MSAPAGEPEKPAKKKHRHGLIAIEVLTVLIVVGPIVAAIIARSGRASPPAGTFSVQVRNDGVDTLTVRTCAGGCPAGSPSLVLTPGASAQLSVSSQGAMNRFYVVDSTGSVSGCLPLRFTHKVANVTVLTSQAEACPGSPLPEP